MHVRKYTETRNLRPSLSGEIYHLLSSKVVKSRWNFRGHQPRSQGLSRERRETLVVAGHVPPRIWVVTKTSLKGGRLRLLLSILSLQEGVKCCHQNNFHVAPVCCITVMSQCNTVQTPKILYGGQNFVEEQPSLRFWFVTQIT